MLAAGLRRLIVGAGAEPITTIARRWVDNYKAWIDTDLEGLTPHASRLSYGERRSAARKIGNLEKGGCFRTGNNCAAIARKGGSEVEMGL